MSCHIQVLIPESLDRRIHTAARLRRLSTSAWVREALEQALKEDRTADPLERLSGLGAPTCDVDQMLTEIASRRG
jgi:hypothetical protein